MMMLGGVGLVVPQILMDAEFRMATDPVAAYHQMLRAVDHMKQARVQPEPRHV
jgi:hypothetical protein